MKASDYISEFLHSRGVTTVFELSGGMITHLLDSISRQGKIKCISVHHEQTAAFAAEAVGRMTGVPGIALATSGPGATNLLTGIGSCYFDSSPAVFITGQVNRDEQKRSLLVRQLGFQETDIVAMAQPITKAAWKIEKPEELPDRLSQAFALAIEGRPGPVLIDIPMDVQRSDIKGNLDCSCDSGPEAGLPSRNWTAIFERIASAKRPLILAGGGIRSGRACEWFRDFVNKVQVPVVNSLMGVDVLPHSHPLRVGLIGTYGNRWANIALSRSDLLIVIGSRLDVRQTGSDVQAFKGKRHIYHIDCDAAETNNRVKGCELIISTVQNFLKEASRQVAGFQFPSRKTWVDEIAQLRAKWPDDKEQNTPGINPNTFLHALSRKSAGASAFISDVGQHQMWAAQSLELNDDQRFLTSGGMGSMGFALPASIGVAAVQKNQPVVLIAGDGGFQCNIQELQTVIRNGFPIKMVIMNNHCHGMVRQFQESYFDCRYQSTMWGYSAPEFVKVAQAYGISGRVLQVEKEMEAALDWLWSDPNTPMLLDVTIDQKANAYPKIAFGRPITDMEPLMETD